MQTFRCPRRSFQWVLYVLWYGFFALQVPAAYRIILKDGTVLEARSMPINMLGSYEFIASGGQFRTIPLERVDIEGTKAANDSADTTTTPTVFTNEDFPSRPPEPDRSLSAHASESPDRGTGESLALSGEAYWREEARKVREKMEEADAEIASLSARIQKGECPPATDTECYLVRSIRFLEARKKDLEDELAQLAERGRKARALPGWFR